jgi:hypothetical protein
MGGTSGYGETGKRSVAREDIMNLCDRKISLQWVLKRLHSRLLVLRLLHFVIPAT